MYALYSSAFKIRDVLNALEEFFPYFIPFITYSRFIPDKNVDTFCINANLEVRYNENFCLTVSVKELYFIILHEFMHIAHNHTERGKLFLDMFDHEMINIAADMEINSILINDVQRYYYNIPVCCANPAKFGYKDNLSMEEYLDLMSKDKEYESKVTGLIKHMSKDIVYNDSKGNPLELDNDVLKNLLDECAEHAKGSGSNSYATYIEPKPVAYPWKKVIMNIVTDTYNVVKGYEYATYKKLHRRNTDDSEIIMPSWYKMNNNINVTVIFDVSSSMYDYKERVYGLLKSLPLSIDNDIHIRVLETDTEVLSDISDFNCNSSKIKTCCGRGTDLRSAWNYIKDKKIENDVIICLTDGLTDWPKPALFKDKTVVLTTSDVPDNGYTYYRIDLTK